MKSVARFNVRLPITVVLILLGMRGVLLWLVVPLSLIAWPCLWPILRRHNIRLAQFLGWVDLISGSRQSSTASCVP